MNKTPPYRSMDVYMDRKSMCLCVCVFVVKLCAFVWVWKYRQWIVDICLCVSGWWWNTSICLTYRTGWFAQTTKWTELCIECDRICSTLSVQHDLCFISQFQRPFERIEWLLPRESPYAPQKVHPHTLAHTLTHTHNTKNAEAQQK